MTWDRLRTLGYVLALVLLGVVVFSLYGAFRTELEKSHFIGFLGGVVLGTIMVSLIMVILIVPERRRTAWVEAITTVNAKYLFLALIIAWALAMGLLASLNLEVNTVGRPGAHRPLRRHLHLHGLHLVRHRRVGPERAGWGRGAQRLVMMLEQEQTSHATLDGAAGTP